jgi:NADH-quinone oxidoreductase subunit H
MTICAYLVLLERKLSARMQDRIGPNRVGPWGLLQPLADGIKLVLKEDPTPAHVDKVLYRIAPMVSVFTTLLAFAVVPFGPEGQAPEYMRFIIAPHINIGLVFIFAVTSLAVYGVILGGWASNNKYSMLGSLRASAQVVSYEIPLGMSVIGIALMAGSLNLEQMLNAQATGFWNWNFWYQPLACLVFFTSALAESNRMPFDLPECEQELVGGYHTEYGGFRFAMYFLGEYVHVTTVSFLVAILFFGGWHFPWFATPESTYTGSQLVKIGVLLAKVSAMVVLIMLIRWTIPRFRFDQLMGLGWKVMLPLALLNLFVTGGLVALGVF